MGIIALPRRWPAMHRVVARILHWLLQKLSAKAFFCKKVDDLFSRRLQNFTVLNKAGPTSQQSQFFRKKSTPSTVGGHGPPWSPSGYDPGNATQHTASVAIQRRSECECCRSVSPPNDPRTGRFLTVRLLPWDTQASKHASVLISKCCSPRCLPTHDVYVDHQRWSSPPLATSRRRHWWFLV